MSKTIYRYGERVTNKSVFSYLTDGLAIFGGLALATILIDSIFLNNELLINFLAWLWEVTR